MRRLSATLFIIAMTIIYISRLFKIKRSNYVKIHITIGLMSIVTIIINCLQKMKSSESLIYIIYVIIMILIVVTGYFYKKNRNIKIYHIIATIPFLIYLFIVINFFE